MILSELKQSLGAIQESIEAYKRGAEELGNTHILPRDPKYISLIVAKAQLLMAIAEMEQTNM